MVWFEMLNRYGPEVGRAALEDYAESCSRTASGMQALADDVQAEHNIDPQQLQIQAETLRHVAAQARAFPGAELAVLG